MRERERERERERKREEKEAKYIKIMSLMEVEMKNIMEKIIHERILSTRESRRRFKSGFMVKVRNEQRKIRKMLQWSKAMSISEIIKPKKQKTNQRRVR